MNIKDDPKSESTLLVPLTLAFLLVEITQILLLFAYFLFCDFITEASMKTSKMFHVDMLNFYQEVGNIYLVVILAKYLEKTDKKDLRVHVLNFKVDTGSMNPDGPAHFCYSSSLALAPNQAYTAISTNLLQCVRSVTDMTPW